MDELFSCLACFEFRLIVYKILLLFLLKNKWARLSCGVEDGKKGLYNGLK
jgi:hypothetical protein